VPSRPALTHPIRPRRCTHIWAAAVTAGLLTSASLALAIAAAMANTATTLLAAQPAQSLHSPSTTTTDDPLAADLQRRLTTDVLPLLNTYCLRCHTEGNARADVRFDTLRTIADAAAMGDIMALAHEMVSTGQMPIRSADQPSDLDRLILQQWFHDAAHFVPADAPIDPGWFTIHRLNRSEYRNTLRDLLGIQPADFDVAARLPADDTGYGFDNIADVLTVSPLTVDRYLEAAEAAVGRVLGPIDPPDPLNERLALRRQGNGTSLAAGGVHLFSAGSAHGALTITTPGTYAITVRAWQDRAGDEDARFTFRVNKAPIATLPVPGSRNQPSILTLTTDLPTGRHTLTAEFINDFYEPNVADRNLAITAITVSGPLNPAAPEDPAAWQRTLGLSPELAADRTAALAAIERFAARAYRRPLTPDDTAALASLHAARLAAGRTPVQAVRDTLCAVLVSPHFLYRAIQPDLSQSGSAPRAAIHRLRPFELASRLSYFLWSSMPDEALLLDAASGDLTSDQALAAHVRRMLADPRAEAFITNFTGQWLHLRTLDRLEIDRARFPDYTPELQADMATEARLFFADILRSNKPIHTLLDADYTFLNQRLAAHYGLPAPAESPTAFVRTDLPENSHRGGVLTMAGVLTVTSNTTRTSPVKRGLFVLEQVLGTPPPPPPADIPPLEQAPKAKQALTLREILASHVENPSCAACHNRLDPVGLAFEHFDAIGRWRDTENGQPIDASGTLPGGQTIRHADDLKAVLIERRDQFTQTLAAKLLTYAVGRGVEPFDRPAIRSISARAGTSGGGLADLVTAIVLSDTFRTARPKAAPTATPAPAPAPAPAPTPAPSPETRP